jgi:Exocyst complex component Sec10
MSRGTHTASPRKRQQRSTGSFRGRGWRAADRVNKPGNSFHPIAGDALFLGSRRILQKHIKRQIISLNGGFQVIADLNAYHTFISSLKVN